MRNRALGVFDHLLRFLHPLVQLIERRQILLHLSLLSDLLLLSLEVVLGELDLDLVVFAHKEHLLGIAFGARFLLLELHVLTDVELNELYDALISERLRALQVQALVEANLGEQVVDVFGLETKFGRIPLAEIAKVVVEAALALQEDRHVQDLEANGALKMAHAEVVLVSGIVGANLIEAVPAVELLDLLFLHAVAAHGLFTVVAEVHLITDEDTRAPTLIVNVG